MANAVLGPEPVFRAFDPDGLPLAGGKLYTYAAGTLTPLTTYKSQSEAPGNENANPIILDANGEANVWLSSVVYKFDLYDLNDVQQPNYPVDNIAGSSYFLGVAEAYTDAAITALKADLADTSDVTKGDALIGVKKTFTGAVARTQHQVNDDFKDSKDSGCVIDGVTDDTANLQKLFTAGGQTFLLPGSYSVQGTLNIDMATNDIYGSGVIFLLGATGTVNVYSSVAYADKPKANWNHKIRGIAFVGNDTAATIGTTVGKVGAAYENGSDILFEDCSWTAFPTLVKFTDNAWRCQFVHCGFDTVTNNGKFLDFPAGISNAGEVMTLDRCWFSGNIGDIYLYQGQWNFNGCSFGIQSTLYGVSGANIQLTMCNIESQPSAGYHMIRLNGNSNINWTGGNFLINDGTDFVIAPIILENASAAINFNGVFIQTIGASLKWEADTTYKLRDLVCGPGRVTAYGVQTYLTATLANHAAGIGFSKSANILTNGDAEYGNTNGWTAATYGTPGSTAAATAAAKLNGSYGFEFTAVATGGLTFIQTVAERCPGRLVSFSFAVYVVAGVGAVDFPVMEFLDNAGAVISGGPSSDAISGIGTWKYYGVWATAPAGTASIRVTLGAQALAAGCHLYYDEVKVCVL